MLSKIGLHKQVANRLLEPWVWHTAIVSATEFDNFFKLRDHKDAQPEFQVLARAMRVAMEASEPRQVPWDQWHLPYISRIEQYGIAVNTSGKDVWLEGPAKVSAACCARVSYVRQNDRKSEEEDVKFTDKLSSSGHFSPLEHPAVAMKGHFGNFQGWKQLRKFYPDENGISRVLICTCAFGDVYSEYEYCEACDE